MTLQLTRTQSRYAAVAILLLVAIAIASAIAWPTWRLHHHYDAALDDYTDRLTRYRRVAALRPAIEQAITAVEKSGGRKYFLKGPSATLAAAELQGMVTKIVDAHKGHIVSIQVLPFKDEGKSGIANRVSISVNLNASIVPLMMILHTTESQEPCLFVDNLTVRANQGRAFRALPGVQPEFGVQMTLHGYLLTSGGAS
jgi:general secretion pathway protein M